MKVIILGSGNVAIHLGRVLTASGISVAQVYNRSTNGLKKMAAITKAKTTTSFRSIATDADLYLIAISDDGIASVAKSLSKCLADQALVAHTSGSTSISELSNYFKHCGVLYPLQSLQKDRPVIFKSVPLFITGSTPSVTKRLISLAQKLSNHTHTIEDEQRIKLHLPAVVVNNFVNHLYMLTYEYCQKEKLDMSFLFPLMNETLDRIKERGHPAQYQTGPGIREDQKTLKRHRRQLKHHPTLLKVYNYLTRSIRDYHENR